MQSPALLLLVLGATAAAALKCQTTKRTGTTFEDMAAKPLIHYRAVDNGECTGAGDGWQACAHLITNAFSKWDEWRSGCWSSARGDDTYRPVATLIHKYCADASRHQCVQTLRMESEYSYHHPLYICCCYGDDCDAKVASFARQQLLEAPKHFEWKVDNTCLHRESKAWSLDVLNRGPWQPVPTAHREDCNDDFYHGPCADFVYQSKAADGKPEQWHHWLAGCYPNWYKSELYDRLVVLYCSASTVNQCFTFDMAEPASQQARAPYYTTAYLCCCQTHTLENGQPRTCRDTVAFAQAEIAKRLALPAGPVTTPSTLAAAITTAPTSSGGSLSSVAADTTTSADADTSPLLVVLIIVALVVVIGLVIAAAVLLVLVCVKEKTLKVGADTTTLDTTAAGSTLATTATVD